MATSKRHDFVIDHEVGFDADGRVEAVRGAFAARCGLSSDLSGPVTDRAPFHAADACHYPDGRPHSHPPKTNTVSDTAFRGFGGPQGVIAAEHIMNEIARRLGRDPLDVRRASFYDGPEDGRDVTPYHQSVEDNVAPRVAAELEASADCRARRRAVLDRNARGGPIRTGIALTPVQFGISTATCHDQVRGLLHVHSDGSIHLNHGGIERGQGLDTKIAQIVADALRTDIDGIEITRTTAGELWWDDAGPLRTRAPSTCEIPSASDRPRVFDGAPADCSENRERTIERSRAVGEPPCGPGISVLEVPSMVVTGVADHRERRRLDAPATPERLPMPVERLRG